MCGLLASAVRSARLYNPKYRAKHGFFDTEHKKPFLRKLPDEGCIKWNETHSGLENYAHNVVNAKEKVEDLVLTITKIFSGQPKQKVCVYASRRNAKDILQAVTSIKRFPEKKPEQTLMLRKFRRSDFAILLSDGVGGKLPSADVVVHFDLPKNLGAIHRRIKPQRANIFFYLNEERVYIAHLQNAFKTILANWELPSKKQQLESFVERFGEMIDNMLPIDLNVKLGTTAQPKEEILAALMYFIYRKLSQTRKQYLLYDPSFTKFKTRRDVEQFLSDSGITNYDGITLTKKGFVVDSYELLTLPLSHETVFEHPQIRQLRRKVNSGCISTHRQKQKAFNVLAKHHEHNMIRAFRMNHNAQVERHQTRLQTAS